MIVNRLECHEFIGCGTGRFAAINWGRTLGAIQFDEIPRVNPVRSHVGQTAQGLELRTQLPRNIP